MCRVKQYTTWGTALLAVSYPEIRVLLYVVKFPVGFIFSRMTGTSLLENSAGKILDPSMGLSFCSPVEKESGIPAKRRVIAV